MSDLDWKQERALRFMQTGYACGSTPSGGGIALCEMEMVELAPHQLAQLISSGLVELDDRKYSAYRITDAGRAALASGEG